MKEQESGVNSRRAFLQTGAAVGAGAVASTLLPDTAAADDEAEQESGAKGAQGYRLTQHVLDFYKSAKI